MQWIFLPLLFVFLVWIHFSDWRMLKYSGFWQFKSVWTSCHLKNVQVFVWSKCSYSCNFSICSWFDQVITIFGEISEWENWLIWQIESHLPTFNYQLWINLNYTYSSSFTNILSFNWFRLIHFANVYPIQMFPYSYSIISTVNWNIVVRESTESVAGNS